MAANDWRRFYETSVGQWYDPRTGMSGAHLRVKKRSGNDGITWDVLQAIKNDLLGPEVICVEVFPAQPNLVYEVNMRHLWEVPEGFLPFNLIR